MRCYNFIKELRNDLETGSVNCRIKIAINSLNKDCETFLTKYTIEMSEAPLEILQSSLKIKILKVIPLIFKI